MRETQLVFLLKIKSVEIKKIIGIYHLYIIFNVVSFWEALHCHNFRNNNYTVFLCTYSLVKLKTLIFSNIDFCTDIYYNVSLNK